MAPPKTQAQINADAEAARLNAQTEQDARTAERQSSMMGWLGSFMPDFSFGGLLQMALIFTGIYFLARTEWGGKMLNGLVDMLPEDWKLNVAGALNKMGLDIDMRGPLEKMTQDERRKTFSENGVSEDVLDIIDPRGNTAVFHKLMDLISANNGGKVTMHGFTSASTISALIQQDPEMALKLVNAMMKPGADGKPGELAGSMNESLKTIIKSNQLDILLNSKNQAYTIKLLASALPADTPISEQSLANAIAKGLDAKGRPTDALRQLFLDAIDGQKNAVISGAYNMVGPAGFVDLIDTTRMTSDAAKYAVQTIQNDPKAKAAYVALATTLGNEKAQGFIAAFQSADAGTQVASLLLNKDNVKALPQAIALLDQLPELASKLPKEQAAALTRARKFLTPQRIPAIQDMVAKGIDLIELSDNFLAADHTFSMERTVNALLKRSVRDQLKQVGTANVAALLPDASPLMNPRNLDAILNFAGALDTTNKADTQVVLQALAKLPSMQVNEALKGLNGGQIAAFFSVPANQAAFKTLLNEQTGLVGDTVALQQELGLLRKNLSVTKDVGLVAILSDKDSAQFLLNTAKPKEPSLIPTPEFVQRWAMQMGGGDTLDNSKNQDIILELGKVLSAGTTTQSVAGATPSAADRTLVAR